MVGANVFLIEDLILAPRTAGELDRLKALDTGQPLQPPRSVAERRFLSTNQVPVNQDSDYSSPPSGTGGSCIFIGDWPSLLVGTRTGITIEASRLSESAFRNLQVMIRAYLRADVAVTREENFAIIRGIVVPSGSPA